MYPFSEEVKINEGPSTLILRTEGCEFSSAASRDFSAVEAENGGRLPNRPAPIEKHNSTAIFIPR
jgi:hypothetical protein